MPLGSVLSEESSYVLAGAFVGFLIQNYGLPEFRKLYATGQYEAVYGKSLVMLENEWRSALSRDNLHTGGRAVGAPQAAEPIGIELVQGGKRQELSDQARSQIADRIPKVFATCSINSRDHPEIFASWRFATIWEDTDAKDHLLVQLAMPIEIQAGRSALISVERFMVGLHEPEFPWPQLSRHGQHVVAYVKCSGIDLIKFVCAPDIKALMPASYHRLCRHLEHSRQGFAQPPVAADAHEAARV